MLTIIKKEFNAFFASTIAYLVIGVFLLINGLNLWVFTNDYNILNSGFADVNSLFRITPWVFLFLIPALTMKSFAEEFNTGTIELLKTRPVTTWQIVLGKFYATLALVFVALAPTLIYCYSIYSLKTTTSVIDFGSIIGSYLGLFFLAASYTAIGLFTSTLSKNQITAFIISALFIAVLYFGFNAVALLFNSSLFIENLGIYSHYKSIARGVLDTRDAVYFLSIIIFFLLITKTRLDNA